MRLRFPLPIVAAATLAACRTSPVAEVEPSAETFEAPASIERADPLRPQPLTYHPGACATLTDAEGPDVLRVLREQGLALYVDRQAGLAIVDIANPEEPIVLATSALTGEPLGLFVLGSVAVVVYQPWDRPPETIVRAVEVTRRHAGRVVGEVRLEGTPRDARRAGDAVVVTRELRSDRGTDLATTAVSTFVMAEGSLTGRGEIVLGGGGAVVGGSPWGVAVARQADRSFGKERTAVTWVGVDASTAALDIGGTAVVDGVVPRWRRGTDHVVDVTEDAKVRVVGCATAACPSGEAATYAAVDFSEPALPRRVGGATLARAGDAVVNFSADRLFVARPPRGPNARDATELAVFDTTRDLELRRTVSLRGTISSLALRGEHVVALGWTGTATEGRRAILHDVDVRRGLTGTLSFGGDWTWTPAFDDDRALSFHPSFMLGALPMTVVRGRSGPLTTVQVFSFAPSGPRPVAESVVSGADRLLFVDGRLLTFSAAGVSVVNEPGEQPLHRTWDDLNPPNR